MAELRPATTTTAFCYNCHRYLLRPATGFVTSVHFFRMQMFATCNGELQPATMATFLLQPCLHFATTNNEKCYNGQLYLLEPVNRQRGGAASMACAGGTHPWRARTAMLHPWRARPEELHPWRARISDKRGRRSCIRGDRCSWANAEGRRGRPPATRERRGGASSSAVFSRGMAWSRRRSGGGDNVSARGRRELGESFFT